MIELLNFILIALVAFSGIIIGAFLIFSALEEYSPGKLYFKWFKKIILFILILILLFYADTHYSIIIGLLIGFLLSLLIKEYFFLGLSLVIGFLTSKEFGLLIATFIFIFGLPYGTLELRFYKVRTNILIKKIIYCFILFIIPFISLFFQNFMLNNIALFIGIVSGALFNFILKR